MSHFSLHPEFYDNPIRLSEDHKISPVNYLREFFLDYKLIELRQFMAEIVEACLSTDTSPFEQPEKRADLMLFHKNLELLFEATFVLLQKSKQNEGNNE